MTAMNLLVIGGSGLLGQEVTRQAQREGARVLATSTARIRLSPASNGGPLDIRNRDDVTALIQQCRPATLLELAQSPYSGIHHIAGADAVSRHELGALIARRDGLDDTKLPSGLRAQSGPPGPLEVRLDCAMTQSRLKTRLRGAREFLTVALDHQRKP